MIYIGNKKIGSVYIGDKSQSYLYVGNKMVYQKNVVVITQSYIDFNLGFTIGKIIDNNYNSGFYLNQSIIKK